MRTIIVAVLAVLVAAFAAASPALASDSYSWGAYGADYGRSRTSNVPAAVANTTGLYTNPWVVPDPHPGDQSQSTPVVVGGRVYFFAFASQTQGALYESNFTASGAPGPAREVVSFAASANEAYNSPGDPSVSPDGKWLAYAAGYHLYWWQIGNWCAAGSSPSCPSGVGRIPPARIGQPAYVSSAPLFVPDPTLNSGGWDVCSGSGNGGFACYAVEGSGSILGTMTRTYTTHGSAITSSAVSVSPSLACFGVAAPAPRSRVVCLDPHGSAVQDGMGSGHIRAPVDTALTYADGSLYFTDQTGVAYRMDPLSGAILAENTATSDGASSIAPVAVDGRSNMAYVVADGYSAICALDATTLAFYQGKFISCISDQGQLLGQFTAATAVPVTTATCQGDLVWAATDGGVVGAAGVCPGQYGQALAFAAPDGAGGGHNFSAAVVGVGPGSAYVVMWSDTAVSFWCQYTNARIVGMTAPCAASGGGLEVWRLGAPLTAWFDLNTVPAEVNTPGGSVPPDGECLFALAKPGQFASLTATLPNGGGAVAMASAGYGSIAQRSGPLFTDNVRGCPNPATIGLFSGGSYYQNAEIYFGKRSYPNATAGTDPGELTGSYQLWAATGVRVPSRAGAFPASVRGTDASGNARAADPVLYTSCPGGYDTASGGSCSKQAPAPPTTTTAPPAHRPPVCGRMDNGYGGWACYPAGFACMFHDHCVNEVLVK